MKVGDEITLNEINKWKNKIYKDTFNSARFWEKDGCAWWARKKREVLNNTKLKVIALPNTTPRG